MKDFKIMNNMSPILAKKILFTTDGTKVALNGYCMYFLRTSTKRTLGEETFQVRGRSNKKQLKSQLFYLLTSFITSLLDFYKTFSRV